MSCPFRLAVINDEITQDFGRACEIASKEFGLNWIELRGMWNKKLPIWTRRKSRKRGRFWRRTSCG